MTIYCFECGSRLKGFEKVISDTLTTNKITIPEKTKFLRKGNLCGIETDVIISEEVQDNIQGELTRIHDLLPEPEPDLIEPVEIITLKMVYDRLEVIESKIDEVLKK